MAMRIGRILMFAVPLAISLGFGYLFQQYRQTIENQDLAAQMGSRVLALIEEVRLIDASEPAGSAGRLFSPKRQYCVATFRYSPPGTTAIVRKRIRLNATTICQNRKAGDSIYATVVRGDDRIFLLDEDKIAGWWSWLFLALFVLFGLFAMINLRALLGIRRPGAAGD